MSKKPEPDAGSSRVRLDKWLWAARVYKTRSLAAEAVEAGQARVGDDRVKSSHAVRIGDRIVVRKGGLTWHLDVTGLAERRGGAADAAKLYGESDANRATREEEIARRKAAAISTPVWPGRPTKRERRKLQEFLEEG
jgi:ribosome-associated heat shock protein Hsp15